MNVLKRIRSVLLVVVVIMGGMFAQVFYRDSVQSADRRSGVVVKELFSTNTASGRFYSNHGYFLDQSGDTYKFSSSEQFSAVAEGDTLDLSVKKNYVKGLLRSTDTFYVAAVVAVRPLALD